MSLSSNDTASASTGSHLSVLVLFASLLPCYGMRTQCLRVRVCKIVIVKIGTCNMLFAESREVKRNLHEAAILIVRNNKE